MRIGVNSGSIDALDQRGQMQRIQVRLRDDGVLERTDPAEARRREREHLAERMVTKALEYISWCEEMDFHEIKVSLKSSTVLTAVEAYRRFAQHADYPLHLGTYGGWNTGLRVSKILCWAGIITRRWHQRYHASESERRARGRKSR